MKATQTLNAAPMMTILLAGAVTVALALLVAAAPFWRGSNIDLSLLPTMAAEPVVLANGRQLYVQKHEVTIAEWNACHSDGGCALKLDIRPGLNPHDVPATGLNFQDVMAYLQWINARTGHHFRLPSADEWNQMAASVMPEKSDPIFTDPSLTWASAYLTEGLPKRALQPRGSFSTTSEGIADLDGSVWEWTQQCYAGKSEGINPARCPAYFVGGEHVAVVPFLVRDPARGGCAVGAPPAHLGMRLVSDQAIG